MSTATYVAYVLYALNDIYGIAMICEKQKIDGASRYPIFKTYLLSSRAMQKPLNPPIRPLPPTNITLPLIHLNYGQF